MDKIEKMLLEVGVPAVLDGYQYLHDGIALMQEDPIYRKLLTKLLYPTVAKKNNTTAGRVERAMRHAVECAFDRMPPELQRRMFGNSVSASTGKATNGEFMATMALHLGDDGHGTV